MIDTVAKALHNVMARSAPGPRRYWEMAPPEVKEFAKALAVAATEAMREPDAEMLEAAYALHREDTHWDNSTAPPTLVHKLGRAGPKEDFKAMITAALGEVQQ